MNRLPTRAPAWATRASVSPERVVRAALAGLALSAGGVPAPRELCAAPQQRRARSAPRQIEETWEISSETRPSLSP